MNEKKKKPKAFKYVKRKKKEEFGLVCIPNMLSRFQVDQSW